MTTEEKRAAWDKYVRSDMAAFTPDMAGTYKPGTPEPSGFLCPPGFVRDVNVYHRFHDLLADTACRAAFVATHWTRGFWLLDWFTRRAYRKHCLKRAEADTPHEGG